MSDVVHVAAGVIISPEQQVLLSLRPSHVHQGGLWEFPGGKVEAEESVAQALSRELAEELAIEVSDCRPLLEVRHDYPDKSVLLDVWLVLGFKGEPQGNEGQSVRWVSPELFEDYAFPAANLPIVRAVQQYFGMQ